MAENRQIRIGCQIYEPLINACCGKGMRMCPTRPGLSIELMNFVVAYMNIFYAPTKLRYYAMHNQSLYHILGDGSIDIVPPLITATASRAKQFEFITPISLITATGFLVHQRSVNARDIPSLLGPFETEVWLVWIAFLFVFSLVVSCGSTYRKVRFFSALYRLLLQRRPNKFWRQNKCICFFGTLWALTAVVGLIRFKGAYFKQLSPSFTKAPPFYNDHHLGSLVQHGHYTFVSDTTSFLYHKLVNPIETAWNPIRNARKHRPAHFVSFNSHTLALHYVKTHPGTVMPMVLGSAIYHARRWRELPPYLETTIVIDHESARMMMTFTAAKNWSLTEEVRSASLVAQKYGLIRHLQRRYGIINHIDRDVSGPAMLHSSTRPLNMRHVQSAVVGWAAGLSVAFMVFIMEHILHKMKIVPNLKKQMVNIRQEAFKAL